MPTNTERERFDRIASFCKSLGEHPGEWNLYPYSFPDESTAREFMASALEGGIDAFRVDSALFRWRFSGLPLTTGIQIEMRVVA
ncbi:MAG: hypothetical protein ABF966_00030 [Bifidobacterium psychraerophilum]|uniref:hypothetical protein n=1 Tax=Bifidobacterium psychraerophilum TaxID=218140 RepID=UPI0039EC877A